MIFYLLGFRIASYLIYIIAFYDVLLIQSLWSGKSHFIDQHFYDIIFFGWEFHIIGFSVILVWRFFILARCGYNLEQEVSIHVGRFKSSGFNRRKG